MSVPVPKRGHGEMEVNTKARALTVYTLKILENPKWFPKEQAAFIAKLQDCVIEIQAHKARRGECSRESVDASWQTWMDHIGKGDSWRLRQRLEKFYRELWEGEEGHGNQKTDDDARGDGRAGERGGPGGAERGEH